MVWPHNTAIVIFVPNQYSSKWSFFNWAQQLWQRAPAGVFSPHFHWNWVVMNILRPGSEVSHREPLSLTCRHQAGQGETMPTLSTNESRVFGSRDFCRPMRARGGGEPIKGRIQHSDWIVRILECTAGIFDISIMLLMIHQEIITNS